MRITKSAFSIISILLGFYMFITGAVSTLDDEPARMAMLAGLYWVFFAAGLWLFKSERPTLFNVIMIVGVTIIMMQYLILNFNIMLIFQIALLLIMMTFHFFKWI